MALKDLQRDWDELGRKDPLWAILTAPGKRGRKWTAEEFFQTGVSTVDALMTHLDSLGVTVARGKALDFGCGAGRLTQALCRHFDQAWGVDIAPSMLELARKHNRYGDRCRYHLNEAEDLGFLATGSFDFVCSIITLQHMPPRLASGFIRELVRVLVPGGILVFQVACEPTVKRPEGARALRRFIRRLIPEALIRAYRKLRYGHLIDMYGIPRHEVVGLLEASGATVVDVREDTSAGGGWTSFQYCARKR